ncbi:hypothetical protein SLEP1_g4072 [Rubroshorea leprosula]|uniref:Uncharacterized protein n=1 Tax=Rubroshorea leprosula TaxID=152421 RepID=A0AAV5HVP3_9ROSI|nr:hypothetical protein SLEP1_g4072 [Rubroshorea leprosula]
MRLVFDSVQYLKYNIRILFSNKYVTHGTVSDQRPGNKLNRQSSAFLY